MITPGMIYLIGILDNIKNLCVVLTIVTFSGTLIATFLAFMSYEEDKQFSSSAKNWGKGFAVISLCFGLTCTAIPSTRLAAAMYVVPAVANNEDVRAIGGNSLEALRKLTEQWLLELDGKKASSAEKQL